MFEDERMLTFIRSLDLPLEEYLEKIREEALADKVPLIRQEMLSFLQVLLTVKKPKRILEVGTAVGFSALWMAECTPGGCLITTIENYEKRIEQARDNFAKSPHRERIILLEGDAQEILPTLEGIFDFVFMDAAKGQYLSFLPHIRRLLAPGALLVSDNILQEGEILQSHYAVPRRSRTIHKRMREYLRVLKRDPDFITSIVPIGDGAAMSVYAGKEGL